METSNISPITVIRKGANLTDLLERINKDHKMNWELGGLIPIHQNTCTTVTPREVLLYIVTTTYHRP